MALRFDSQRQYNAWLANRDHLVEPSKVPTTPTLTETQRVKPLILKIPIRPVSWNVIYGAPHWHERAQLAKKLHEQVAWQLQIDQVERIFFAPRVDIHVDAYFHGNWLDSDNIPIKLLIDGLRGWVLKNDDPRFVRRVSSESHMSDTGREWIEISIKHVKEKKDGTQDSVWVNSDSLDDNGSSPLVVEELNAFRP